MLTIFQWQCFVTEIWNTARLFSVKANIAIQSIFGICENVQDNTFSILTKCCFTCTRFLFTDLNKLMFERHHLPSCCFFLQEVILLRNQIAQSGVHVDIDAPKGQDLAQIMAEIRAKYEKMAQKNQDELKAWHESQVDYRKITHNSAEPAVFG